MNKVVLAQIDTIAGNIEYNEKIIIGNLEKAKQENADLIIFPELSLIGYPFGDIFIRHKSIIDRELISLGKIKEKSNNITVVIGYVEPTDCIDKKPFYNSVAVFQNKELILNVRKKLLPNYAEFNDYRYFEPSKDEAQIFQINNEKYGILICEDSFNHKSFSKNIYSVNPISDLMEKRPDTIINCACSPSRCGKEYTKNILFSSIAKENKVNYIYVNKAGYGDNLVFEGGSRIYNKNGNIILRAKTFEEDFVILENLQGKINELPKGMENKINFDNFELNYQNDLDRTYKSIVYAIKQYFEKNGFNKAVLGLSGGLDSSVCSVLLTDALGKENVFGISMPSKITSIESKNDAQILAENLGIHFLEIPISDSVNFIKNILDKAFDKINTEKAEKTTTIENLQARIRASILWSVSNEYKHMLPIATSDKSEAYIGYATVNGDMSGGFAPIADVTKTKLFALAEFLNKNRKIKNVIPKSIIEKPPGAELKLNPKTGKPVYAEEDNMPYEFLDEIIWLVENKYFGKNELLNHNFLYEKKNSVKKLQKEEWINKFFWKSKCAVYKWHILPPSVILDTGSINSIEYHQPIISKVY